ncbi:MAG: hypothetical protein OXL34_02985 [Gemmatimonadota bacterium]|nr:hypothetical protein [Gemmatimonadota bacterium]
MPTKTRVATALLAATTPLVAATAAPHPTAAQQTPSRVLVATHAVCRAGPSRTAEVVALLVPRGNRGGLGQRIAPLQAVTSTTGEVWFQISPADLKWADADDGCWLSQSVLPPSHGPEADLLTIADRLLGAPEGRPLTQWVAAHNLFLHRWHREMVDASALLSLRRLELLDRAMSAVGEPGRHQPGPDHLDPLVRAWVESLGDQVVYSSRYTRNSWKVSREAFEALHDANRNDSVADEILRRAAEAPSLTRARQPDRFGPPSPARARPMAIIVPDATCRREPLPDARVSWTAPLDHHFSSDRADTVVAGVRWTLVSRSGCWVQASLTAPGDTDEHVLRIAESYFAAPERRSREYLLRVYNVLSSRRHGHADAVERSPILSLRRMELLERGFAADAWSVDPLTLAVIRTRDAELRYYEPAGGWSLRDEAVLNLYERYRGQPEAHEILWRIASAPALHDCEGDLACFIQAAVLNRVARYWADYPEGPRVTDAVARAVTRLSHDLEGCRAARDAEEGSREARWLEGVGWEERGAEAVRQLRATLSDVREAAKAPLARFLDDLERCAAELGER